MKKNIHKKLFGIMKPSVFLSAFSASLMLMSCMVQTGGYSETDGVYYNPNTDTLPAGYGINNSGNQVGNYYDYQNADSYPQYSVDSTYNGWQNTGITSDWGTFSGSETNYYGWDSPWYGYGYYPGFSMGWRWGGSPWGWNSGWNFGFNWGWGSPWYGGYYDPFWGSWYNPWYSGIYYPYYYGGGYYGNRWGYNYPRRAAGADRIPVGGNRAGTFNRAGNSMRAPGLNNGNGRVPGVQNNRTGNRQYYPNMNNGRVPGGQMRNTSPQYTPNQQSPRNDGFRNDSGFRSGGSNNGGGFRSGGFGGGSSSGGGSRGGGFRGGR